MIGNVMNLNGDVDVMMIGVIINMNGQISLMYDLLVVVVMLWGGGIYSVMYDVNVSLQGDYMVVFDMQFNVGYDFVFMLFGIFMNNVNLQLVNNLSVYVGNIINVGVLIVGGLLYM